MGWKSIEMQVALPRTQDAGKLQDQMTRQNQHSQESLIANQLKQDEQKRKRVNEFAETDKVKVKKDQDHSNQTSQDQQQEEQKQEDQFIDHPYLGNKIDFSG
ncbi:hypothetical protein [Lentibacillus sp. Marseille-P4043]|uniref:hypothetical protein n=1 Tax=Lentibacillus sp. Marseille-P4043 TaxID=2040293 RepID=UPI000D0BA34F|nr:hypothetical protein [Lentibacillus sp. Marseille-P4043]